MGLEFWEVESVASHLYGTKRQKCHPKQELTLPENFTARKDYFQKISEINVADTNPEFSQPFRL